MQIRLGSRQTEWLFKLVRALLVGALFLASGRPSWALAQTTDDPWTEPVNLSHSGVAINPSIAIGMDGVVHAVWQDDLADYWHSEFDGDQWTSPERTDLNRLFRMPGPDEPVDPLQLADYTGPNPLFIAGPNQRIFAFWINPEGRVYVSSVENQEFKDIAGWGSGRLITPGAASFAAAVDARGQLHVAFLSTESLGVNPPGIYYTRSENNGGGWSKPVLLYESPYLRTLARGEAHLSIATVGIEDPPQVYVAWDNRPRKQVFLAHSADGGANWEPSTLVAASAPDSGLAGPFNIQVGGNQESVVLVWQNGQPGGTCTQVYQSSSNAGATWSEPQPMIEDLAGCAASNEFVIVSANNSDALLFLMTEAQGQVFLTAWNGLEWSRPRAQAKLAGFEEPEIYTDVIYGCRRNALAGERLYVIGCDEAGGGDVWVTSRDLGSDRSWFEPPIWSELAPVTSANLAMEALELVATQDGLIHTFFSQRQDPAVYYTFWNGELWSRITPVLQVPDGEAGPPSIATGPGNELFLVVPNQRGALYFSRATSGSAATRSNWSSPMRLAIVHDGAIGSVNIALDAAGTLHAVYSVPVNEDRGIYMIQSKDFGVSWSEPLQVFNGVAAGFDIVGAPSLLISETGRLHIIWKQQIIQGDGVPQSLSLYYSQSEDGGHTFSEAGRVIEEPVDWQEIVTDQHGNLHLLWQPQNMQTTVWDQVSSDGGRSWEIPQGLSNEGITSTVMTDSIGRLHLVDAGTTSLGHWLWDGSHWLAEEPLQWSLDSQQGSQVELMASVINPQGKMVIVMLVQIGTGDSAENSILYSTRTLELPQKQNADQEDTTPTLSTPTLTPATATPESLSTLPSTVESEPTNSQGETDSTQTSAGVSPLTIALLPVALLLLGVLGLVIRRVIRVGDR